MVRHSGKRWCAVLAAVYSVFLVSGCSTPHVKLVGPAEGYPQKSGDLSVSLLPVDVAKLPKKHPFHYRGDVLTGFTVFRLKILNSSDGSIPCNVFHRRAVGALQSTSTVHERKVAEGRTVSVGSHVNAPNAYMVTEDGQSYPLLTEMDFMEKYTAIMTEEMARKTKAAMIPYFGLIAAASMADSPAEMQRRKLGAKRLLFKAAQLIPGIEMKGYLVFDAVGLESSLVKVFLPIQRNVNLCFTYSVVRN